jgi:hypothetical protein
MGAFEIFSFWIIIAALFYICWAVSIGHPK